MIIGHGIDLQDISEVKKAYQKNPKFAQRVLTDNELAIFLSFKSDKRQMEFLAGRWAAKEAFSKAVGTGIGKLGFHDIEILPDEKKRPSVTKSPFGGTVFLSIAHSGGFAQASVILEEQ